MKSIGAAVIGLILAFLLFVGYDLAFDNGEFVARLERMF